MRLPTSAHTSRPWRIHELAPDFDVEDVWALPTPGGPDDLPRLVSQIATNDFPADAPLGVRVLWAARWTIGAVLGWDDADSGVGLGRRSLRARLPSDLRDGSAGPDFGPFTSVYRLEDEWAAEIGNRTVHAVMHIGWVEDGAGSHHGQMAVLVKPNGLLGAAYMAAITPFRHLFVYPALLRTIERGWAAHADGPVSRA
jgi:hypothetical protein